MTTAIDREAARRIVDAAIAACIAAARDAHAQAAQSGLCESGAMEAAIGAMQMLDRDQVVRATLAR